MLTMLELTLRGRDQKTLVKLGAIESIAEQDFGTMVTTKSGDTLCVTASYAEMRQWIDTSVQACAEIVTL